MSRPLRRRARAVDPARRAAYDVLRAVTEQDAYANLVLPRLLRERGLTGRDAALATELAYGTLRRRGTLDAVLARCSSRPLERVAPAVLDALRLGAQQLLGTRVPAHAAVATTVDLVAAVDGEGAARFANAVLRAVAARDLDGWVAEVSPDPAEDPVGALALASAHPRWTVEAVRDALGGDLDETAAALAADDGPAEVHLVARPGRAEAAELVASGARAGRWSPYAAVLEGGDPLDVPAVREGRAGVQDEGSQLVALALAAAPVSGPDAVWGDLCAGPGGKAALLAGLAGQRGAALLAVELRPHRAALVARALAGGPVSALVAVADTTVPAWAAAAFDRVLVDVPCTGLGALRRRPDARWRRTEADLAGLGRLQRLLLGSALDAVRPGGVVAYATCSPHLAETVDVVRDVTAGRADVDQVDGRALLPDGMPQLGDGPCVQLWPHRHGTDAMFLALLRRCA